MGTPSRTLAILPTDDINGLRLVALGRVPRCEGCPRYAALCAAYETGGLHASRVPPVPGFCHKAYCAPLVARLTHVTAA